MINEISFDSVKFWIKDIAKNKGKMNNQFELILAANNFDETDYRIISRNLGKELANKYNVQYFEISCLKKIKIYELLYEIALLSYKKYKGFEVSNDSFPLKNKNLYSL